MELHQFAIAAENSSKRLRQLWPLAIVILSEANGESRGSPGRRGRSRRVSAHGEHGLSHHWNDTLPVDTPG